MPAEKVTGENIHFLISYTTCDRLWAEWIGTRLEQSGYQTILRDWDFRPGQNAVLEMDDAIKRSERTLLVITPAYLNSDAFVEWAAAFRDDPRGKLGRVLPVRVELCNPRGILGALVPIDLVGLAEQEATRCLLDGVLQTRARITSASFPGVSTSQIKIPDGHFLPQLQQIEGMLRVGDYGTAFVTIDGLLRSLYEDYLPRQRARMLYLQGLVYLKGKRPRYLTHSIVGSASKLLAQAGREYPLRAYAATLAAVESDYAGDGLRRAGVDPQALLEQARHLRTSEEDKPAINILLDVQPELYQAFRHLF
jgi:hypothetical protein